MNLPGSGKLSKAINQLGNQVDGMDVARTPGTFKVVTPRGTFFRTGRSYTKTVSQKSQTPRWL